MYFPPATARGTINLWDRPMVPNRIDGGILGLLGLVPQSYSTVRSITVDGPDGSTYILPTVSDDGRIMSDGEAYMNYLLSGRFLGKFGNREYKKADEYAVKLHENQAGWYGGKR